MATNPTHGMTAREEEAIGALARTSSLTDWGALGDGLGRVDPRHSRGCDRKGGGDRGGNHGALRRRVARGVGARTQAADRRNDGECRTRGSLSFGLFSCRRLASPI